MSIPVLRELKISHLRGSVTPFSVTFEKGKKLTVVYGENGTGKSTICDALEFLGNGSVSSLDNRGLGSTRQYWPSLGKGPSDVSVTLETGDGTTCSARMQKSKVTVEPEEARPTVQVLRRSQILSLVEANPSDRYNAIRHFIDVDGIEASEGSLRELIRELEKSREVSVARVQENEETLEQFWNAAERPGTDALSWAKQQTDSDQYAADAEISALTTVQSAYAELQKSLSPFDEAIEALTTAKVKEGEARVTFENLVANASSDTTEIIGLLESAQKYYHAHATSDVCPLCESSENAAGLSAQIDERLKSLSSIQTSVANLNRASATVRRAEEQLSQIRKRYKKSRAEFEEEYVALPSAGDIPSCPTPCPSGIDELSAWLHETESVSKSWKAAETRREDLKKFLATLKQARSAYIDNLQGQKKLDALIPNLKRALEIIVEERKKFTDSVLSKIAEDVGTLYEAVHPNEGLNRVSLDLDPKFRASLKIAASFSGQSSKPPQAYFSDSHLDTLGLCVFLALAALDGPEKTILVLDDVLASVDEPHVERLIQMLYTEASKFRHCIITTHYRPWKEKLRWGWLQNGQCQFIELSKWTDTDGLKLIRSVPDAKRLRALIAESPPDPQLVCAKAGVILEAALTFLSQQYGCKVPHRVQSRYTLGELLPSMNKKLRAALIVEVLVMDDNGVPAHQSTSLGPILDELERIAQARNLFGCHFNELSFDLLESDAINFGVQALQLIEVLADPDAGWPKSDKSGSYWANAGETRRLHPLRQPK